MSMGKEIWDSDKYVCANASGKELAINNPL